MSFPSGIVPFFNTDNGFFAILLLTIVSAILSTKEFKNSFWHAEYEIIGFPTSVILVLVACGTLDWYSWLALSLIVFSKFCKSAII